MRKNNSVLTAHPFTSATSDRQSRSFSRLGVCWSEDTSKNQLPRDGVIIHTYTHTHTLSNISGSVILNGTNV